VDNSSWAYLDLGPLENSPVGFNGGSRRMLPGGFADSANWFIVTDNGGQSSTMFEVFATWEAIGATQTATRTSTDTPIPIPDATGFGGGAIPGAPITSTIPVSGLAGTIQDVNVTVNIAHTFTQDLIITLTSPSGQTVQLFNRRGGAGDNLNGTVFDDEASTPISGGAAPFAGSFRPETPLSVLDGASPNGAWQLTVTDNEELDIGNLLSWSISFGLPSATPGATNATYTINDGGTPVGTAVVNQQLAPAPNLVIGGRPFQRLGVFPATTGVLWVQLSSATANGIVSADAVAARVSVGTPPPPSPAPPSDGLFGPDIVDLSLYAPADELAVVDESLYLSPFEIPSGSVGSGRVTGRTAAPNYKDLFFAELDKDEQKGNGSATSDWDIKKDLFGLP
jgi:subtilisin-like proprotein convertase family protein